MFAFCFGILLLPHRKKTTTVDDDDDDDVIIMYRLTFMSFYIHVITTANAH